MMELRKEKKEAKQKKKIKELLKIKVKIWKNEYN